MKVERLTANQALEYEIHTSWWLPFVNNDLGRKFINRKTLADYFTRRVRRKYKKYWNAKDFEDELEAVDLVKQILQYK